MPLRDIGRKMDDFVSTKAVQLMGGGAEDYLKLAARYEELGWMEEAVEACRRAIAKEPQRPNAYTRLGALYARTGEERMAQTAYERAIQYGGTDAMAYVIVGKALERKGATEAALALYREALTLQLPNPTAYELIGHQFAAAQQPENAVQAYRRAVRVNANQAAAYGMAPADYDKLKQHPEALDAFRKSIESKPSADGYAILGSAYEVLRWYQHAAEAYATALRLKEEQTYGGLPAGMTDPKACKKSIQTLKEAIRINPQDVRLYRKLGALYEHMNLDAQAFEILKHAARMDRANASGWEALGAVALRMNHMEEAWKAWREAARLNPARAETFMGLGLVYNRMGRFKDAMHMCQIALRLSPDDALALNHLGEACSGLKDHAGAEQAYLLSVRSKPTLPALSNLGKLYMGLCQYDKAIAAYRRITQLAPQDTEARMGLGLAYAQLGNLSAAIQQSDMLRPLSKAMARDLDAKISKLSSRIA